MKYFILCICALWLQTSIAQISVDEDKRNMSQGTMNSFRVELPNIEDKTAENNWKKYTKQYKGKLDWNRKEKEWVLTGAEMPSLSTTTVTVYAKFEESGKGLDLVTTATFWFDTGNGFISSSSNKDAAQSAEELVRKYAVETAKEHAEDVLKEEENALASCEKDMKNLVKESYEKKIKDAEKLIAEMKEKIEENADKQEILEATIEDQKRTVKKVEQNLKKFEK